MSDGKSDNASSSAAFASRLVDQLRRSDNLWRLPGGELRVPRVFGFCRGVTRALAMLQKACQADAHRGRLFLLGQIIHNPWVNDYFQQRGVRILSPQEIAELESHITAADCAIIPAFGVPLPVERRLRKTGCSIVDTSCGDVRRLWVWAEKAARNGFGLLIFGRANHDETVVTKSRLENVGGNYVVAGDLDQVRQFCRMIADPQAAGTFRDVFGPQAANADRLEPFYRLAQVSQTTMLYDETMEVRRLVTQAYGQRFGEDSLGERLAFEPTVCRATQDRQAAAVELCRSGVDLVVVVGGFGSSNTRHLYELARSYTSAFFLEDVSAILSDKEIRTRDFVSGDETICRQWLPARRPLRIGVLAGASTPEEVVGQVLQRLGDFLA